MSRTVQFIKVVNSYTNEVKGSNPTCACSAKSEIYTSKLKKESSDNT